MKKVQDLSYFEIKDRIKLLEDIDSKESIALVDELKKELENRSVKRWKETVGKISKTNSSFSLVDKQKQVIGKCYKNDNVYYKVLGVYKDKVLVNAVSFVEDENNKHYRDIQYLVSIDLLKSMEEVREEEFNNYKNKVSERIDKGDSYERVIQDIIGNFFDTFFIDPLFHNTFKHFL